MAVLLLPMSAIPDYQHHMTAAHGHSVPSNLSHNSGSAASQSGNKRPKLSLQTSSLPNTYGSLTRGLAPSTTQTIYTPTTANTLANTWDLSIRPSPVSRAESPKPLQQARPPPGPGAGQQPYAYSLPFGLKPILKNSPLPPRAASVSASPRESRRKVFFPQPKRVSFKQNLEEPIETKQYTARHSDLTSSEEETSDEDPAEEPSSLSDNATATNTMSMYHSSPPPNRKRKTRRDSGIYVDAKTVSSTTTPTPDDNATIKPPSACKRRKWHSTSSFGGPIEKEGAALKRNTSSTRDSKSIISEDTTRSEEPSTVDDQPTKEDYEEESQTSSPLAAMRGLPNPVSNATSLTESGDDARSEGDGDLDP